MEANFGSSHSAADVEKVYERTVATVSANIDHSQLVACKIMTYVTIVDKYYFDHLQMYGALMNSCFCRTCLIQMALKTPMRGRVNHIRANRLRSDIRSLDLDATEGIDAVALDNQLFHWQASILGPAGSPYEGGKFFLYIVVPCSYPMLPPQVRFLTKIVHPNVSRHGDVGIDIIQHNWSLALTISKLLLSVQSLLTDPFTQVGIGICFVPGMLRL